MNSESEFLEAKTNGAFVFHFSLFIIHCKVTQASNTPSTTLLTAFDAVLIFLRFGAKNFLKKKLYLEKQSNIFLLFGVSLMIPASLV